MGRGGGGSDECRLVRLISRQISGWWSTGKNVVVSSKRVATVRQRVMRSSPSGCGSTSVRTGSSAEGSRASSRMVSIGGAPSISGSCSTSAIARTTTPISSSRLVRRKSVASTRGTRRPFATPLADADAKHFGVRQQAIEVGVPRPRGVDGAAVERSDGGVPEGELVPSARSEKSTRRSARSADASTRPCSGIDTGARNSPPSLRSG